MSSPRSTTKEIQKTRGNEKKKRERVFHRKSKHREPVISEMPHIPDEPTSQVTTASAHAERRKKLLEIRSDIDDCFINKKITLEEKNELMADLEKLQQSLDATTCNIKAFEKEKENMLTKLAEIKLRQTKEVIIENIENIISNESKKKLTHEAHQLEKEPFTFKKKSDKKPSCWARFWACFPCVGEAGTEEEKRPLVTKKR